MEKYDVGIFGLWYGHNYGSIITYYALSEVIKSMGYKFAMIKNPLGENVDTRTLRRSHALRFADEHYNITPLLKLNQMNELNNMFDSFVLGSDQMWNYGLSKPYKQAYYFDFVDDDKLKIAYATSFGKEKYNGPEDEKRITEKNLKRFNAISVRDDFSKNILSQDFGVKSDTVLDPVFMCPVEKYEQLINEISDFSVENNYIFAYILDPSSTIGKELEKIAEHSGKKVYVIFNEGGDKKKLRTLLNVNSEMIEFIDEPTVQEWLYLYKNADYVLTDSFHGTCFSIIFRRQFIVLKNKNRGGGRFPHLLSIFALNSRMIETPNEFYSKFVELTGKQEINYDTAFEKSQKEKDMSFKWLENALNGKDVSRIITPNLVSSPVIEKHSPKIMNRTTTIVDVMYMKECTGCSACSNVCPVDAIEMTANNEGMLKPVINRRKCISCGICKVKCPASNPVYKNEPKPRTYAMMADEETRKISSSAGMFSVVAEYIIDNNGYVCGAAYDKEFKVHHIIIKDKKELPLLRGSKYIQSNPGNVYREIKELLTSNKLVLFTGMPCQVAGLYAYLGKEYENLITIDLLCHGITSSKVFEKYHREVLNGKQLQRLEFKEKEPWGWHAGVNAYFTDGTKYSKPLESDLYFIAYLKSIAKNTSCEVCKANRLPRQGDLTIGDFWGIAKSDPEMFDGKGTSVVLVNNSKAQDFFDKIKDRMFKCKEEPLKNAINGNHIIEKPYKLHKNRNLFFENFDKLSFEGLTLGCFNNKLYESMYSAIFSNMSVEEQQYYYLAETAAKNANGRQIVTWIRSGKFEKILKEYFGLSVAFGLTQRKEAVVKGKILDVTSINGKSDFYYLVSLDRKYDKEVYELLNKYGYKEFDDFVFKVGKPIVVENHDLSAGNYFDSYGNSIEGFSGIIKKAVFRGSNNHILLGKEIKGVNNLEFDLSENTTIRIDENCRIFSNLKIESRGYRGNSSVIFRSNCRFTNGLIKLYNHDKCSSILVNEYCTFETNLELHANSGKKIIIGRDCMFSHDIDLWAGDGHTVFDVETGKNKNSAYDELPKYRNMIVIGEHVWVAKGAFIMHGTDIGNGSIVGAKSVVKGKYPNNCTITGNPARLVKKNVAWSRDMTTIQLEKTIERQYYQKTNDSNSPISGMNVLVIGGTRFIGIKLVEELIKRGNNITIATRGTRRDNFGNDVSRIKLDVSDFESCKKALEKRYFDVVFDNLAYCSEYAFNILSNVVCGKYIQLSSVEAYKNLKVEMKETYFDPYKESVEIKSTSVGYVRGKRSAESIAYQKFPEKNIVTVRIPYVAPTDRLYYYCEHIVNNKSMSIENLAKGFTFINDTDVGRFLPWISNQDFQGPINFASSGMITVHMILEYIESKVGMKAIIDTDNGDDAPFNVYKENTYSMNIGLAQSLGYEVPVLNDWIWTLLDKYIEKALKNRK